MEILNCSEVVTFALSSILLRVKFKNKTDYVWPVN